ncbi:MAG: sigma-70 family RNA polymerase sigma factor [Gemmatimonadaceae bacterium]
MPTSADREWFEREVLSALPDLYGTALRLSKNSADAEDLVADTVAKAWTHLDALRDRARTRGWLFKILSNAYISDCRARALRPTMVSLDDEGEGENEPFSLFERLHQPFLLWWGNPERDFLDKMLRADLDRAVGALPEAFRLVVVMADVQGLSYKEISETLGVPIGTVRSRLARGRSLLQKALWKHAVDAGLVHSPNARQAGIR